MRLLTSGSDRDPVELVHVETERAAPLPEVAEFEQSSILQYWPVLWRHKWIILAGGILAGLAGLVYTLPKTPVYQARTTLEIQGLNENFLNIKNIDPTVNSSSYSDGAYLQTQIKILQSRTLISRVIAKLGLEKRPEFASQGPAASPPSQA